MEQYEYNQIYLSFRDDGTNHLEYLNANGINGWELVSAVKIDDHNICYFFKRVVEKNLNKKNEKDLLLENN